MATQRLWKCIESGPGSGSFNMEYDERIANQLLAGDETPVLRLYRWEPWSISLGHNQEAAEIDEKRCKRDLMDIVRRPTGGRAILHAEELTYSVAMIVEGGAETDSGGGVLEVYKVVAEALVAGLKLFGVDVELQRSQPAFGELYQSPTSVTCFTSSARYEIESNGRKLVGSAQRRYRQGAREVVLQHGSILIGPAHKTIVNYLRVKNESTRQQIQRELDGKTTDLAKLTEAPVNHHRLAACIKKGFENAMGVRFGTEVESGTFRGVIHV